MLNRRDLELIEAYLLGNLSASEEEVFKARLASDYTFAEEFQEHKVFLEALDGLKKRRDLKQFLNKVHDEEIQKEGKVVFMPSNGYRLGAFFKKHLPTMAVAASVAIITVLCSFVIIDYLKSVENKQFGFYQELKREVDNIKLSQKRIKAATEKSNGNLHVVKYSGTGFVISSNGYLVTNYHIIKNADSLYIESRSDNFQRYKVEVVASDVKSDISILRVKDLAFERFEKIPFSIKINDSDLGEEVFTLAFPREDMVYGAGSISSKTGYDGDTTSYQISVPVNPGNSGGPLLDERGNLIGIITGKNTKADGAAFAIKAKYLVDFISELPDSVAKNIEIPRKTSFKNSRRPDQIKQIQDLVFNIRVYNN
jgi:serine protease Do